jgi:hypothetical protein
VLGALAALSACGSPPASPAAQAPPPPSTIDGRYRGIARLTRANIRGCPRSGARLVAVEGNALSLNYRGTAASYALVAVVSPGGSIHGSDGRGTIDGRISGSHMDLTVSSDQCEVRYELDRIESGRAR